MSPPRSPAASRWAGKPPLLLLPLPLLLMLLWGLNSGKARSQQNVRCCPSSAARAALTDRWLPLRSAFPAAAGGLPRRGCKSPSRRRRTPCTVRPRRRCCTRAPPRRPSTRASRRRPAATRSCASSAPGGCCWCATLTRRSSTTTQVGSGSVHSRHLVPLQQWRGWRLLNRVVRLLCGRALTAAPALAAWLWRRRAAVR